MSVRSPSKGSQVAHQRDMEDVELGSSSQNATTGRRMLKAKDSNIVELTPLVVSNGDGSKAVNVVASPRGPMSPNTGADSGSFMKSIVASAMYSGCSVGMVLVNKSLASRCVFLFLWQSQSLVIQRNI